jgi:hypothetical protein
MRILAAVLIFASAQARAESVSVDITKKVGNYYQYDVTATKTFTVTKVTAALTAWSKPMTLVLRCDGKDLGAPTKKTFTNPQLNIAQTFTASAEIDLSSCPSKSIEAFFETPGLQISESPISLKISRGRLLDENFVRMTNDQIEATAEELVGYSGTMSSNAASEPTLHCIIQNYSKRPGFSGIIQELKTNYFNTFGEDYIEGKFTCPPTDSLEDRINTCVTTTSDRTPFCNTVKLYNITKAWFVESYLEAKSRKALLSESQQVLIDSLSGLQARLKSEVEESDGILGIETGFGEEDQ